MAGNRYGFRETTVAVRNILNSIPNIHFNNLFATSTQAIVENKLLWDAAKNLNKKKHHKQSVQRNRRARGGNSNCRSVLKSRRRVSRTILGYRIPQISDENTADNEVEIVQVTY